MMDWTPEFNLASVPDPELWSEVGRRRARQSHPKPKKLAPCVQCGVMLGVVERRGACPSCGARQPLVRKKRGKSQRLPG